MPKKKPKNRERGTTSVRCPKCGGQSRVLRTVSDQIKNKTQRERICSRNHRFVTTELPEPS